MKSSTQKDVGYLAFKMAAIFVELDFNDFNQRKQLYTK